MRLLSPRLVDPRIIVQEQLLALPRPNWTATRLSPEAFCGHAAPEILHCGRWHAIRALPFVCPCCRRLLLQEEAR